MLSRGRFLGCSSTPEGVRLRLVDPFDSHQHAGKAVVRRAVNGRWFWKIERGKGNWVRLTKIRRAGTALYT